MNLKDAQDLAARATSKLDRMSDPELPWTTGDRDRDTIASALRRMERHQWVWLGPDYADATADLLRHCAPYVEVPK